MKYLCHTKKCWLKVYKIVAHEMLDIYKKNILSYFSEFYFI